MLFTTIQELAKVASPGLPPNSKLQECYDLILKGASKELIIERILKDTNSAEVGLRQIKFKLEAKLVNNFVSRTTKTGNTLLDEASVAYKYFAAGKLLLARSSLLAGAELLEKSYKFARKAQVVDVALSAAQSLASYHSGISGDYQKFKKYQEGVQELFALQQAETLAVSYFNEISFHYTHRWNSNIAEQAFAYCAITESSINASAKTAIAHFHTLSLGYISNTDFEGLVEACNDALLHFEQMEQPPKAAIYNFNIKMATGLIHLKRFDEAQESLKEVLKIVPKGKYSYCSAYYYLGLLGLHSEQTHLTLKAIETTLPYWDDLPVHFVEQWKILRAYCALFEGHKFKIGKFLNEVPVFEKDKVNANASILIVQMLHYLKTGNTHKYTDRCEALAVYIRKFLSGKKAVIGKMLIEVSRGYFKPITVEQRTKKLRKQLKGTERDLEIMPAERIWRLVMEWLK